MSDSCLSFREFEDLIRLAAGGTAAERAARSGTPARQAKGFSPLRNTGLKLQNGGTLEISLDYAALTGKLSTIEQVRSEVKKLASVFLEHDAVVFSEDQGITIGRYYQHTARTPNGLLVSYTPVVIASGKKCYDVRFAIPSKVLKRIHFRFTYVQLKRLKNLGFKPTRLDIAIDDYDKRIHPDLIRSAIRDKNLVRIRKSETIINDAEPTVGFTIYLGSRQSNVFFRYYDKFTQSGGKLDCWRLEGEFKDEYAESWWQALFTYDRYDEKWCKSLLLESLIGSIDFRDRSQDENVTRCPRLSWWECFIEDCGSSGGVRFTMPRQESTLQSKADWVGRQVETTLALFHAALGESGFLDYVAMWVASGQRRFNNMHRAILKLHSEYGCERLKECYNE